LAFLIPEQQLAAAGASWQRRTFLELPVVAEQMGMLLSAGYSLGSSLNRLGERAKRACGHDLRGACRRMCYGMGAGDARREWAVLESEPYVDRLVTVPSLKRWPGDLGRLISEEARAIRRDVQRELVETIERQAQLVWIPVTVAGH